ncbi:MAG: tripartite tricarboxylate transporter TctB family protein [Beijerinckiaceae bacterium]|jgi:hypothetical protein|nr:tripartite tricarboxylate transporter TctB family protein [Beijerinckiaceae bacterium]MDO9441614.1 tripartite tricarboxylate transporter TctB family protein [Beijerinckiaceae bacterium]
MTIRAPKDFWSGLMFLTFAAVGLMAASGYSMGRGGRMGPGYFPLMLSIVLGVLGAILLLRSLVLTGEKVEPIQLRPLLTLVASVLIFGAMIPTLGLVISLSTVTLIAAFAGRDTRPKEAVMLSIVLTLLSVGIFVYALRLPLSVWPVF